MAHQQQIDFCKSVKQRFPHFFCNRLVLDIGSLDINGNNQYLFDDCLYIGVDLLPGRNVDFSVKGHELGLPDENVDVIISTECFEHDPYYALTLRNIIRMLKPGGLFIFSCATTGRQEHGTRLTTPADAPFTQEFDEWTDYYKNLNESDIRDVFNVDLIFEDYSFSIGVKTCDLYFYGIKKGIFHNRNDYSFLIRQSNLRKGLDDKEMFAVDLSKTIKDRDKQIDDLRRDLTDKEMFAVDLLETIKDRDKQIADLRKDLTDKEMFVVDLSAVVNDRDRKIADLIYVLSDRDIRLKSIITSNSWHLTRPMRFLGRVLRGEIKVFPGLLRGIPVKQVLEITRKAFDALDYVCRFDFNGLLARMRAGSKFRANSKIQSATTKPKNAIHWGVITTHHTQFIANLIADRLQSHGWHVEIETNVPSNFHYDCYIVICPQMFEKLPPGEKFIAFQMEQSVSSRWFTDSYLEKLENSLAVLEYAIVNIDFMANKGVAYPHVHYLPIGAIINYDNSLNVINKTCDILFYGDYNSSPRRQEMLEALMQNFNIKIVSEVFGNDMHTLIKQSHLVINLHYYENALLEMPRIQECLSLGVPVVSESAQDQHDYPELIESVRFFEQGSIPAMLNAVRAALKSPVPREMITKSVELSAQRFAFLFDRFLVAMGFLPVTHVNHMSLPIPKFFDSVALSLPESTVRRRMFETVRPTGCVVFEGIRSRPGWIGCGLSYMALAQNVLKQGMSHLNVMEDDVLLPPDFEDKMVIVNKFLKARSGKWDVFAGVIAALHSDTKIISVELFEGITFVTINKMTSMVFNIYNEKVLRLLASWNPSNTDAESNTIDRYLESQTDLQVVITLPFFVGHRDDVNSTLWGFQNTQYNDMIANSERMLESMILLSH